MKRKKLNNAGFTLIELLAVITIMGILMMVAIPAVTRTIENTRRDSFMDVAHTYINAMRNSASADELNCKYTSGGTSEETSIAGSAAGTIFYFPLDSKDDQNTMDLMESGGKSSWGNKDVAGYVVMYKEASNVGTNSSTTKMTYSILLVDESNHGIDELVPESKLSRAKVKVAISSSDNTYAKLEKDAATRGVPTQYYNAGGTAVAVGSSKLYKCELQ